MKKGGFTLIELLVVISIISLLSTVIISSTISAREKAYNTERNNTAIQLIKAMELSYNEDGYYPLDGIFPLYDSCFGDWQTNKCGWSNTQNRSDIINNKLRRYFPSGVPTIRTVDIWGDGDVFNGPYYHCITAGINKCDEVEIVWFLNGDKTKCAGGGFSIFYNPGLYCSVILK
jgi:prepilin-type N-terminal cleavage/methylation domain-containing protein